MPAVIINLAFKNCCFVTGGKTVQVILTGSNVAFFVAGVLVCWFAKPYVENVHKYVKATVKEMFLDNETASPSHS